MTKTVYPSLYNVRTPGDFSVLEEDALERYNVPDNWLMLELLGLSEIYEIIHRPDDILNEPPPLPKRPSLLDDVVSRSIPIFLRM